MAIDISGNVVSQVLERYTKSAQDKRLFIENILLNQQYIRGKQNGYFDVKSAYAQEYMEDDSEETKKTFNRMLPIFTKRNVILTRNQPDVKVKPISNQIEIDKKTKITNSYIQKVKLDNTFDKKYFSLIKKLETYSMAFYKIIYDNKMGELQKLEMKRQLSKKNPFKKMKDEEVGIIIKMIKSGAINIYVGDSREIYPENHLESELENQNYFIHAKAYHISDIKSAFDVKVNSENISSVTKQEQNKGASTGRHSQNTIGSSSLKEHAMVYEYYEKPSNNVPNGRKIVIAGNKLIDISSLPYRCGINGEFDYNFVCIPQIPQEGYFFGESVYTQLRPVQRRYNDNRNLIIQGIKKAIMGGLLVPDGALEDNDIITNELGLLINYSSLYGKPEELKTGGVISDVWNELALCEKEFIEIGGVNPASASTSANIRSGDQMEKMSQNDENSVGITAGSIIRGHIELFQKILRIVREKAKVLPVEIYQNGMDKLILTPENILEDIYIANAGIIGLTELQQKQQIERVMQLGALNQEGQNQYGSAHIKLIFEEMGLSHLIPKLDSDAKWQEEFINRENNDLVLAVKQININDFDDDTLHIKYHERMLMSSEFNNKILTGENGDIIRKNISEHLSQHRKRLAKAQQMNRILNATNKR